MRSTELNISKCKRSARAIDPTQRHLIRVSCVAHLEQYNNGNDCTASGKASCIASPNNKSYIAWRSRRWMLNACAIIPLARFGPSENRTTTKKRAE